MIPYTLIGQITVSLLLAILVEVGIVAVALAFLFVWIRGWNKVMNLCWRGYDPRGEAPPSPRREVAIFAYGMSRLEHPKRVHKAIREAHGLDGDEE